MFSQKFLISALVLGWCVSPASATMIGYCSNPTPCSPSAGFAAATAGDTFQNIVVTLGSLGNSFTDLGALFSDPPGLTGLTSASVGLGWPAGTAIQAYSQKTMTITLPSNVNAIDFYVGGSQVYISVADSTSGTFSNATPLVGGFFGVTTTSTFTSFTITNDLGGEPLTLGDISFGDPPPTPEVATLLLVATGLFLMGYFRRRLSRTQAARRGTVCTMSTGITPA